MVKGDPPCFMLGFGVSNALQLSVVLSCVSEVASDPYLLKTFVKLT